MLSLRAASGGQSERRPSGRRQAVYRVTEVIGTSAESWEAAAQNAVETAGHTIRDLRVAKPRAWNVTTYHESHSASHQIKYEGAD